MRTITTKEQMSQEAFHDDFMMFDNMRSNAIYFMIVRRLYKHWSGGTTSKLINLYAAVSNSVTQEK